MPKPILFSQFVFFLTGAASLWGSEGWCDTQPLEWRLSPLVVEASPAEALMDDPVVPAAQGQVSSGSGTGTLQRGFLNEIALPIDDRGAAGSQGSFRGLGRSGEDTEVQAFGVPLNFPQGGGFDLATFPQYLWAGYRFQLGPSLGAFEPRASAGTLTLIPWTFQALSSPSDGAGRVLTSISSAGVAQLSAGARVSDELALLAGISQGKVRGPSAAMSGRWGGGRVAGRYHLLATYMSVDVPGPLSFQTPLATQLTARVIPVLQADLALGSSLLKSSVFFDGTWLKYENPDPSFPSFSRDRVQQVGVENAFFWRDWKFGLSARGAFYRNQSTWADFRAPFETLLNGQVTRSFESGNTLIEPTMQWVGMKGVGGFPSGSLGVRYGLSAETALFSRATVSRRFASLQDRYYTMDDFAGNPALRPELDYTLLSGVESRGATWNSELQAYAQLRQDAHVLVSRPAAVDSVENVAGARVYALMHRVALKPASFLTFSNSLTLAWSEEASTGEAFPYLPRVTDLVALTLSQPQERPDWSLTFSARGASSALVPFGGGRIPGYGLLNLTGQKALTRHLWLDARIENLADRPIETVRGYPLERTLSVSLTGEI